MASESITSRLNLPIGLITVMALAVSWSVFAGYSSERKSSDVEGQMRVHEARQDGEMTRIGMSLDRIEEIARENQKDGKEQRKLIETISRWQIAREPGE